MTFARRLVLVFASGWVAPACDEGSASAPDVGAATDGAGAADGALAADAAGGADAAMAGDIAVSAGLTISGVDIHSTFGARSITCDRSGTCFGNMTNVYKLAPNANAWVIVGNFNNGLVTNSPSSILLDPAGNVYTNACAGVPGVYQLPAGKAQWAIFGTGLTANNPTSCNWNTTGVDAAGTLYVGFALIKELWKLPAGQMAWTNTGTGLPDPVRSVATRGNDVYASHAGGVSLLAAGSAAWTMVGNASPGNADFITIDGAGNLYTINSNGSGSVARLAVGTQDWVETTNITARNSSNAVFDGANNGYMVARDGGGNTFSLMKLPAGTLAWTRVLDTTIFLSENCYALANDNIGHLIIQCSTKMLRTKP